MIDKPPHFDAGWREAGDLPPLDESIADQYLGKVVMVGVTYENERGEVLQLRQWAGIIQSYSNEKGIQVDLYDSEEPCTLPPFPDLLEPAEPGIYRLRSTGRVVERPHYLANLSCTVPSSTGQSNKE